jgi:hypothetical protein
MLKKSVKVELSHFGSKTYFESTVIKTLLPQYINGNTEQQNRPKSTKEELNIYYQNLKCFSAKDNSKNVYKPSMR